MGLMSVLKECYDGFELVLPAWLGDRTTVYGTFSQCPANEWHCGPEKLSESLVQDTWSRCDERKQTERIHQTLLGWQSGAPPIARDRTTAEERWIHSRRTAGRGVHTVHCSVRISRGTKTPRRRGVSDRTKDDSVDGACGEWTIGGYAS